MSEASVNGTSGKILATHAVQAQSYYTESDFSKFQDAAWIGAQPWRPTYRQLIWGHLDGTNLLYADGHVKFSALAQAPEKTCNPTNAAFGTLNRDSESATGCGYWSPKVAPPV